MASAYQTDLDECKEWKVELLNYANSIQELIQAVNGKTLDQLADEAVKAAEDLADFDKKTEHDYDEDEKEALKHLREVNTFAEKLLAVINVARERGWYRLELGYLKVNDDGVVVDRRIVNTKKILFKTGERVWELTSPSTQW